ncbi:VapE domain-containing protein, partial [Parabacteroides goldsteinii]|uniref:VapE domain-containing protein n=1 Tax=Parabacteroides goldsteinii TaxID=328812 RepID=UPI00256EF424
YASFIGTSNHKDLLTDTSGSRRYIVINVTGPIDCSPIDYEQLYTQAIHDLYKGERYWFDTEDEKIITENNQEFQVMPDGTNGGISEQIWLFADKGRRRGI